MKIREMTVADLPDVFAVRLSTVENAITMEELEREYGVTPESLAKAMKSNVSGWLCEESDEVTGFAMGNRSSGEVLVLAVHPDHEGKGFGKALLEEVTKWLRSTGHEKIWLCANTDPGIRAYGFYRKLGWRATGEMKGSDEVMVFQGSNG